MTWEYPSYASVVSSKYSGPGPVFLSSSSSSSSSGSGSLSGDDWTYKLYYDPDAQDPDGVIYEISHERLGDKRYMYDLLGISDDDDDVEDQMVLLAYVYKSALSQHQSTKAVLCHFFVVFSTCDWWWSLEKNTKGITLQRSKSKDSVKEKHLKKYRTQHESISQVEADSGYTSGDGRKTHGLKGLLDLLYDKEVLKDKYNVVTSNCKKFAKLVFDFLAEEKTLFYILVADPNGSNQETIPGLPSIKIGTVISDTMSIRTGTVLCEETSISIATMPCEDMSTVPIKKHYQDCRRLVQ